MLNKNYFKPRKLYIFEESLLFIPLTFVLFSLFNLQIVNAQTSSNSKYNEDLKQHLNRTVQQSAGFEENKGQWNKNEGVLYKMFTTQAQVQFLKNEISFGVLQNDSPDAKNGIHPPTQHLADDYTQKFCGYVFNMQFLNANATVQISPQNAKRRYSKYAYKNFSGKATHYDELWYENIYTNVDLRFYEKAQKQLEYDFIVYPGGNVQDIKFALKGIDQVKVGKSGELLMKMLFGQLQKSAPYTYQIVNGKKVKINSEFKIYADNTVGFTITEKYNPSLPLIIDPTALQWSTFLGGSYGEAIRDITVDDQGYIYVTGHTRSIDFPVTPGVVQDSIGGNIDMFVTKLSPDGNSIIWSTYLGGSQYDRAYGVRVNSSGEVYVAGTVARLTGQPADFPVTTGAAQYNQGGPVPGSDRDGVIAKLNADGTLSWATYWGGGGQDRIYDMDIDPAGNVYVTGYTDSKDFPVTPGAYQINNQGNAQADAFIASFSSAGAVRYSTLLGGTQSEKGYAIAVNSAGEAYITGITNSVNDSNAANNFDVTTGAFTTTTATLTPESGRESDAFVTKLNATGSALIYSTLLSGKGSELGHDIALNAAGNAYVIGTIYSPTTGTTDFPTTAGSFFTQPINNVLAALFVVELNSDGSDLVFSNLVMDRNLTFEPAIAIDDYNGIHITGQINVFDRNLPITSDAFQKDYSAFIDSEGFYLNLAPSGTELVYGTYLGGTIVEVGVNSSGMGSDPLFSTGITTRGCKAYVAGTTQSADFPVTPTAYADDGVTVLSGYDVTYAGKTPGGLNYADGGDGTITVFNDPISTNNTLTPFPNGTSFCINGAVDPIDGNDVNAVINLPDIQRYPTLAPYPGSTQVLYQWQVAPTSTGSWTDIPGATTQDFITSYNTTAGSKWYRRIAYATNGYAACQADTSNAVEVIINTNVAPQANAGGPYTFCGGQVITIGEATTPSPDGDFPTYNYNWTPTTNLLGTTSGTFTDITTVPSVQTNTNVDAVYTLQITDSRGCKSVSQAVVTVLKADAGADTIYSCGNSSVIIGPPQPVDNSVTYAWTPTTNLSCSNCPNPTVTSLPPVGSPITYKLTVNGCASSADSIVVVNNAGITLPSTFPTLNICQGDTVILGNGTTSNPAYTYQWAPGFNLINNLQIDATVVGSYAPQAVNSFLYYLTTIDESTNCSKVTTQTVVVNKMPSTAFDVDIPWCPENTYLGTQVTFGVPPQAGMGYTWTVTVVPSGAGNAIPTNAEALTFLTATTTANPIFAIPGPTMLTGGLADVAYDLIYVRTSFNENSPSCFRTDTARVHYAPGENCVPGGCVLNSDANNNVYCGSSTTLIEPAIIYYSNVNYNWTPITGLIDANTNLPLSTTGPHSPSVFANPSVTTDYTLTATNALTGWSCSVVVRVYPGFTSSPVVNFNDVAACEGVPVLIGENAIAGLTYEWFPPMGLNDTHISNPTATIAATADYYVTVKDTVTSCVTKDTVTVEIGKYRAYAGVDRTFCGTSGTIVDLGAPAEPGYTYQWLVPTIGLSNPNSAQTTDTIYTTTTYVLQATHVASGCIARDTVVLTSAAAPVANAGPDVFICSGGTALIGTQAPLGANITYQWSTSSTTSNEGLDPSQSNVAQPIVTPTGTGPWTYIVTVTEVGATGADPACVGVDSITLKNPGTLTVPLTAGPACAAAGVSIGPTAAPLDPNSWSYLWSPNAYLVAPSYIGLRNISVYPPVTTTYHLTATAPGGCQYQYDVVVSPATYVANVGSDLNLCKGDPDPTLNLQTPPPTGATITWTAVSPTTNTSLLSATNIANPTFSLATAAPGYYNYKVTVDYPTGCSTTDNITIKVTRIPTNLAGPDVNICIGGCTTIGSTVLANTSYTWTTVPFDPDKVAQISNVNAAQPTVCVTETTTYQLTITDNSSGCTAIDFVTVNATIQPPTLTVKDTVVCQNIDGTVTINLNDLVVSNTGTLTFWYDEETELLPISDPTAINASGIYYIKSSLSSGQCFITKPVNVTINDLPNVVASFLPSNCTQLGYANDGKIILNGQNVTDHYTYNTGTVITGTPTYASTTLIPANGVIAANLSNPTNPQGEAYTIRIINTQGCYLDITDTLTHTICEVCPTITATTHEYNLCANDSIQLLSVNIALSKPDSVKFVYFTAPPASPADIYTSGTLLGIANTVATATDTTASLTNVTLPSGASTYYIYAIPYPTPTSTACRPYDSIQVTLFALPANTNIPDTANVCPSNTVNLIALQPATTSTVGGSFEWHIANDPTSALVSNPTQVGANTYYLFEKTADGCYNTADAVQVTINSCCPTPTCIPVTVIKR